MCVRRAGADCSARVFCLRCSTARNPDRFGGASAASHVPNIIQNCDIHFSAEPSSSAEISPRNSGKSPLTHHVVSGSRTVISNCLMRYGVRRSGVAAVSTPGLDPISRQSVNFGGGLDPTVPVPLQRRQLIQIAPDQHPPEILARRGSSRARCTPPEPFRVATIFPPTLPKSVPRISGRRGWR